MKTIAILVPESAVIQAIADPHYCFSAVNMFLMQQGHPALFDIRFIGKSNEVVQGSGLYKVNVQHTFTEHFTADLVIIPALFGDITQALELNRDACNWILKQHQYGAEIASLCIGAFLLASTGLLDGKSCSTHWAFSSDLQTRFPNTNVVEGKIITENNGIYSSGGAHSYWNLLLYLVEKYAGRELAILAAKYFAIDIDRKSQASFTIFKGQKNHSDLLVINVQNWIEASPNYSVEQLVEMAGIGRRSLERRFKQATGNSILEYSLRVRMEQAKRHLEEGEKQVAEIVNLVGYTDEKSFRLAFKKITGFKPSDYKKKYASNLQ